MSGSTSMAVAIALDTALPTTAAPRPATAMDAAAFEVAWQAVSLEPAGWGHSNGPSAMAELANQQQSLYSNAFDMTGMQLEGKSSIEMTFEMTRKHVEMLNAQTALNISWAGVKQVRKGIETVMNSK